MDEKQISVEHRNPLKEISDYIGKHTIWCADGDQRCVLPNGRIVDLNQLQWDEDRLNQITNTMESRIKNLQNDVDRLWRLQRENELLKSLVYKPSDAELRLFRSIPADINTNMKKFYLELYKLANDFMNVLYTKDMIETEEIRRLATPQFELLQSLSLKYGSTHDKLREYKVRGPIEDKYMVFLLGAQADKIAPIIQQYKIMVYEYGLPPPPPPPFKFPPPPPPRQ